VIFRLNAPAKVNLVLEVLGRRGDGYHDIRSIMQTLSLSDTLGFQHARELKLKCSERELQSPDNLVLRAARELIKATGYGRGAEISLEKHIPWAAGLGGGSSDAAAALIGLNRLWGVKLTSSQLLNVAAGIGSDVPFFIRGGACLVEGGGEKITSLPDIDKAWFVLLKPDLRVETGKTGRLYGLLQASHFTTGAHTQKARNFMEKIGHIRTGLLFNVFDSVARQAFPGLEDFWKLMLNSGADKVHLAGSGPAIYSLFSDESRARAVAGKLTGQGAQEKIRQV
jgi:4-diphosphocytidyl-2-C-methyl-D-erythritol kinase